MPTPTPAIPTFKSDIMVDQVALNAVGSNLTNIYNYTMGGFRTLKPICAVRVTTTVALANNVEVTIPWDTADINYDAMWTSGATNHLTVNTAGVYRLALQVAHTNSGGGGWPLVGYICINGTNTATNSVASVNTGIGVMAPCRALVGLAAATTIYGIVVQTTTVSQNIRTTDGGCRMAAEWVSP